MGQRYTNITKKQRTLCMDLPEKRAPRNLMGFSQFSSENGRLEKIRFANMPKEHVSVDVYIPSHLPYPTISLPPHTVILQYPYYISIVCISKHPDSISNISYFEGKFHELLVGG